MLVTGLEHSAQLSTSLSPKLERILTYRIVTLNVCIRRRMKSSTVNVISRAATVFRAAAIVSLQPQYHTSNYLDTRYEYEYLTRA